jgi:proteasome lid subunit RPN8/RPN11
MKKEMAGSGLATLQNAGRDPNSRATATAEQEEAMAAQDQAAAEDAGVNQSVILIMENEEEKDVKIVHASLQGLARLSKEDLDYIIRVATRRRWNNLVKWANKRLAKLAARAAARAAASEDELD